MKILIAPDSFKGSLTASEAAEAMATGIRRICPQAELILMPLADGGEGTVEALITATNGQRLTATVSGPLGRPIIAHWGVLGGDQNTAVIEMASAAGLPLLRPAQRDPTRTTTFGVGELFLQAANAGAQRCMVGLGGSATNDGGAGAMQALGVKFYDRLGTLITEKLSGGRLIDLGRIDTSTLHPGVRQMRIVIASDVTNPLLGPAGASAVYGPQKGATPVMVQQLEDGLAHYAALLQRDVGKDVASLPGAGAAGGLGAGLMAFLNAEMRSGIDLVLDAARFDEKVHRVDWVFTGEGRIDSQTLSGKTIAGLLSRCRTHGNIPMIAFGGSVEEDAINALIERGLCSAIPIVSRPMSLKEAMRDGEKLLADAAARVMRLLL